MSSDQTPLERDASGRFLKPEREAPVLPADDDLVHPVSKTLFGGVEAPRTPAVLLWLVILVAVGLTIADVFVDRHDYVDIANADWFYGLWGFGAFVLAVLSGWPLGRFLRRDEDYYGEADTTPADVEDQP